MRKNFKYFFWLGLLWLKWTLIVGHWHWNKWREKKNKIWVAMGVRCAEVKDFVYANKSIYWLLIATCTCTLYTNLLQAFWWKRTRMCAHTLYSSLVVHISLKPMYLATRVMSSFKLTRPLNLTDAWNTPVSWWHIWQPCSQTSGYSK